MRFVLKAFLITGLMLSLSPKSYALEEEQGFIPPIVLEPLSEVDYRLEGGINSFSGEHSGGSNSCSSCGS